MTPQRIGTINLSSVSCLEKVCMNVGTENELDYTCPTEIWVVLPWVELTSELLPELYLTDEILLQVTLQDTLCGAGHISWSRFFCTP